MHRKRAGTYKNSFLYNIANERNRTSDMEETDGDEDSEPEDSELDSASDMDLDKPGTSYSRNIIILN
jgi:hypothetical protein